MGETTIAERVQRGAAWLDEHDPGWWREDAAPIDSEFDSQPIDLDRLDIGSSCMCVAGHRWGHFGYVPLRGANPTALGLTGEYAEIDALTAEWVRVIRARRAEVTGDG